MDRLQEESAAASPSTSTAPGSPAPSGEYTDYILRSGPVETGWRYNIMKFGALDKEYIDPSSDVFVKPVKLNRKDPRTVRRLTDEERDKMNAKAAEGGVIKDIEMKKEEDVKPGYVKKEREEIDLTLVGSGTSGKGPVARNKSNMFKKKTKRVFVSSEEARRLKREEWQPWVLEDVNGDERWVGRLEGGTGESSAGANAAAAAAAAKRNAEADRNGTGMKGWRPPAAAGEAGGGGSSYVAFVFEKDGTDFKVIPASRWYKFSRGPQHATLGTEEAEKEYERLQKSQEPERWMMHKKANASGSSTPSTSTPAPTSRRPSKPVAPAKNIRSRILDKSVLSLPARDAAKPKFRSVIKGSSNGTGDDELRGRKSGAGGRGQEQEDDEFDYEEDFQDDEEGIAKIDDLADEEETKEIEERIRKEMRGARRADMSAEKAEDDDDEEEEFTLTATGQEIKKLVKKGDKEGAYESDGDDFDNPYASSEYEDDESTNDRDSNASPRPSSSTPRPSSNRPGSSSSHRRPGQNGGSSSNRHSTSNSRAGSRSGSPAVSGSAAVAKRATSPNGSGRRSTPSSRAGSPGVAKRKRVEGEDSDSIKRRRNGETPPPGVQNDSNLITETSLIAFFKTNPGFSTNTRDVLAHFRKAIKADTRNKDAIGGLLKSVANLVGKDLVLKPGL